MMNENEKTIWRIPNMQIVYSGRIAMTFAGNITESYYPVTSERNELFEWFAQENKQETADQNQWKRLMWIQREMMINIIDDEILPYLMKVRQNEWNFNQMSIMIPLCLTIPAKEDPTIYTNQEDCDE